MVDTKSLIQNAMFDTCHKGPSHIDTDILLELLHEYERMKEEIEWVSVEDKLPNIGEDVIAYEPGHPNIHEDDGFVYVATLHYSGFWESTAGGMEPSHWKPIPNNPKIG